MSDPNWIHVHAPFLAAPIGLEVMTDRQQDRCVFDCSMTIKEPDSDTTLPQVTPPAGHPSPQFYIGEDLYDQGAQTDITMINTAIVRSAGAPLESPPDPAEVSLGHLAAIFGTELAISLSHVVMAFANLDRVLALCCDRADGRACDSVQISRVINHPPPADLELERISTFTHLPSVGTWLLPGWAENSAVGLARSLRLRIARILLDLTIYINGDFLDLLDEDGIQNFLAAPIPNYAEHFMNEINELDRDEESEYEIVDATYRDAGG